jgi:hypothetical protein
MYELLSLPSINVIKLFQDPLSHQNSYPVLHVNAKINKTLYFIKAQEKIKPLQAAAQYQGYDESTER